MRKRLLFATHHVSLPPRSGGSIRSLQLIQALAQDYEIDLVHFGESMPRSRGGAVYEVAIASNGQGISRTLSGYLKGQPRYVSRWRLPEYRRQILRLAAENQYEVVILDHLLNAHLIAPLRALQISNIVLSTHNVEHQVIRKRLGVSKSPMKAYHQLEYQLLKRFERQAGQGCDAVICVSEDDAHYFRSLQEKTLVIPNGVDTQALAYRHGFRHGANLVFVGNFGYKPNEDAMLYFVDEIWPRIRNIHPECRIQLVGAHPSKALRALQRHQGVEIHADVPSVRPFLEHATIAVIPLRYGGGTKLKILEAMACGVPVVSTSVGIEGLPDIRSGDHVLVADTPMAFADEVLALLKAPEIGAQMSENARRLVERQYAWDTVTRPLSPFIQGLGRFA